MGLGKNILLFFIYLLFLPLGYSVIYAQETQSRTELTRLKSAKEIEEEKKQEQLQLRRNTFSTYSKQTLIDRFVQGRSQTNSFDEQFQSEPINPEKYIVGPGDVLQFMFWGEVEETYVVPVLPEGLISIPSVGNIDISGISFVNARKVIHKRMATSYKEVSYSVDIIKMRKFRIFITGEVQNPGTYFITPQDRISDVFELAGGHTDWADLIRVQLIKMDSTTSTFNLRDYYYHGILSQNPFLNDGEIIRINPVSSKNSHVFVDSELESFGMYSINGDEKLNEFIQSNQLLSRDSDLKNVKVLRNGHVVFQNLIKVKSDKDDFHLESGDRISISKITNNVYVEGAVYQPGPQLYVPGMKALDYAGLAGITSKARNRQKIKVQRYSTGKIESGPNVIVNRGDLVIVPVSWTERSKELFQILGIVASTLVSYTLVKRDF
ncbi:MAG: polysaccharide export protein [Calditrichaeota bacterium]|nr:MAG: polysaccharide export protein [Calditrichota bacterium]